MTEDYLKEARKIFGIEDRLICTDNDAPIRIKEEYFLCSISRRPTKNNTYSFFGLLCHGDGLFSNPKMVALNKYFHDNQERINNKVAEILNKEGIHADASEAGLYLGNGRSVSTTSLWIAYHTNRYSNSKESEFKELIKEETGILFIVMASYYSIVKYIIDNWPSNDIFRNDYKNESNLVFTESPLVKKYIDRDMTNKVNKDYFTAVGHTEKAHQALQRIEERDTINKKRNYKRLH